jgi:hypothetical protein
MLSVLSLIFVVLDAHGLYMRGEEVGTSKPGKSAALLHWHDASAMTCSWARRRQGGRDKMHVLLFNDPVNARGFVPKTTSACMRADTKRCWMPRTPTQPTGAPDDPCARPHPHGLPRVAAILSLRLRGGDADKGSEEWFLEDPQEDEGSIDPDKFGDALDAASVLGAWDDR